MSEARGFRAAVSFLTRVPADHGSAGDLPASISWFPVVGGLVGLSIGLTFVASREVLPPFVAATVAVAFGVFVTGALHEDGLADSADALAGGRDREEALRILRDPRHGTFGVLAILVSLLLRVGSVAALGRWEAVAALASAHALSRGAAVSLTATVRPAASDGLGASFAGAARVGRVWAGAVVAAAVAALLMGVWAVPALSAVALGTAAVARLSLGKIGGVTGDVAGAAEQVTEVLVLVLSAAVTANGWGTLPWWRG